MSKKIYIKIIDITEKDDKTIFCQNDDKFLLIKENYICTGTIEKDIYKGTPKYLPQTNEHVFIWNGRILAYLVPNDSHIQPIRNIFKEDYGKFMIYRFIIPPDNISKWITDTLAPYEKEIGEVIFLQDKTISLLEDVIISLLSQRVVFYEKHIHSLLYILQNVMKIDLGITFESIEFPEGVISKDISECMQEMEDKVWVVFLPDTQGRRVYLASNGKNILNTTKRKIDMKIIEKLDQIDNPCFLASIHYDQKLAKESIEKEIEKGIEKLKSMESTC